MWPRILSTVSVGVGKVRRTQIDWSMGIPEKATPGLMVLRRRTLDSERQHYAIVWPDKLGTDPMAVDGINKWTMTPSRKAGGIPGVNTRLMIQPECGEIVGPRGTGRPNLSRETKFSGANGDPVQLTTSRNGNLTRLIHALAWILPSTRLKLRKAVQPPIKYTVIRNTVIQYLNCNGRQR